MFIRVFKGLGVPKQIAEHYEKRSTKKENLKHAFLRGVIDPTDKILSGYVFLTGMDHCEEIQDKVFITRSPCLKPDDARMVRVMRTKPHKMSFKDWQWLKSIPFGSIIFGLPEKGMKSLPEYIADGDLDGDRYLVCWSNDMLKYIDGIPIEEMPSDESSAIISRTNTEWLKDAQRQMVDSFESIQITNQLTGKLYHLTHKIADESKKNIYDPDVTHFADAFKQALDNLKHGGNIILPTHLHQRVPAKLRKLLVPLSRTKVESYP